MTNEQLLQYANEPVELQLRDGERIVGELLTDEARIAVGTPFGIKQPEAAPNAGPTWRGISDASMVEWVRILEETPETLD
jgi:hypothetical protein